MQRSLRSAFSLLGRGTLKIVLPAWCIACDRELPWQDRQASCCGSCWAGLPRITTARCHSCALPAPVSGLADWTCLDCQADPLPLEWCEAWGHYRGSLEKVLHAFKFSRHDFLAEGLSGLLEETVRKRDLQFDAIAGVPMHRSRERARGYNQAELLARALSKRVGVRCDMTLLTRRGARATQSTLPKRERAANIRGAFEASAPVKGKSILIVDDICTTGETLRACAAALRDGGASRVCAVSVAKAS